MKIINLPIDEIIPYERNPRKNDGAVEAVAASIREFGFKVPIVVDAQNVIVTGHTRHKAARKLGLTECPCIRADDLTPEQVRAYRLAGNKVAELAEWDFDLLAAELAELPDFQLEEFGFELPGESGGDVEGDEPPEQAESRVQAGEVWACGEHRLMCGDSANSDDMGMLMGEDRADLLLTDPPYNVALGMGGSYDEARKRHRRTDGLVIANDNMDEESFRIFLTTIFTNAKNVMKPGACFYIWHADNEGYVFRGSMRDAGFKLRQTLIWVKNTITLGRQDYQWKHEPCLYGWNEGTHKWYSDRKQSTILEYQKPFISKEHPTMKPVSMFGYLIKNSSKQDDIVLDGFGGSGTTMIAAEQLGRRARLMEIDPHYCDIIIARWEQFTGRKAERIA